MNQTQSVTWFEGVEVLQPHVVRITTPRGTGTGFLLFQSKKSGLSAIATAAHVINQAHYWEEPLRLVHVSTGKTALIHNSERAIFLDEKRDTAVILVKKESLPLPSQELSLSPPGKYVRVGNDIGWLGFPAIPTANLCFFGGRISAWLESQSAYLVDGVAINGVSGGPAFLLGPKDSPVNIMGVVSAYMPNRATGETLPGLSVVRDVSQFHELAPKFKSFEQAKSEETPSTPPASPAQPPDKTEEPKTLKGKSEDCVEGNEV